MRNNNFKKGQQKTRISFVFFLAPSGGGFVAWSFDEEEEKITTSTALVSFPASQASYVWRALTAQLKTTLTDSTQSSNQSSERSQAKPQAHTSDPWGETKQEIGKKKRLPRSCGLEIGCFTILSLYNYTNNDLIASFSSSMTLPSSSPYSSSLDTICHMRASTHSVHRLRLGFFLLSLVLFFFKEERNNACSYHTYSSVKLVQLVSNTSRSMVILSMETVALFKSNNKHLVDTPRNQTCCPCQPLTIAVLGSMQ